MKVIFDFDGVVCYSQVEMMRRLSERLGRLITVDDWKVYDMRKSFDAETVEKLKPIFSEDIYNDAECDAFDENIGEAIRYLSVRGHDVSIESICDSEGTYSNKLKYLKDRGITVEFKPVYSFDKVMKADIVVEDCYENLVKADAKLKILITRPWNTQFKVDKTFTEVSRAYNKSICRGSDEFDIIMRNETYIRVDDTKQLLDLIKEIG